MKIKMLSKGWTIAVILLFVGVGIQPAIAETDIIDFKPEKMDKEELTAKINEIKQKYENNPKLSNIWDIILNLLDLFVRILYKIVEITITIILLPFALILIWFLLMS